MINPGQLGIWLAQRREIWQFDLMTARDLDGYASRRGLGLSLGDVQLLWALGLLRADLVVSVKKLRSTSFLHVGQTPEGHNLYADQRSMRRHRRGWINLAVGKELPNQEIRPLFHPFRYYVLHHIDRVLALGVGRLQPLINVSGYQQLIEWLLSGLEGWSRSRQSVEVLDRWTSIADLAIATEPWMYAQIFRSHTVRGPLTPEQFQQRVREHGTEVAEIYRRLTVDDVDELRQALCIDAEAFDPNRDVHTLLRLGNEQRMQLEGRLGGAILFRTMAELLRRAAEEVHSTQLREEDELGFGWTPPGAKRQLYGDDRLFDGNSHAASEFVRRFRLDHGVRIRWYVEGPTEHAFLTAIFGPGANSGVEVVNLAGRVVANGALAFRESLKRDLEAQVFSFISIDADRADNVKVIKAAAEDDLICGRIFWSEPDFEFANFTATELAQVIIKMAIEVGCPQKAIDRIPNAAAGSTSKPELFSRVNHAVPEYGGIAAGASWGTSLAQFALSRGIIGEHDMPRPVVEGIHEAWRVTAQGSYHASREHLRMDFDTGRMVDRKANVS